MAKNIDSKLFEAFDAFTNKDFDKADALLHEFFVGNAKNQLQETWDATYEDDEEEGMYANEVGGDMGDDFESDVVDQEEATNDLENGTGVDIDVEDDPNAPVTKADFQDLDDKIDELMAEVTDEGDDEEEDFDFDDEEGEEGEEGDDEEDDYEDEDDLDEGEDLELDESEDEDEDLEEGVDYKDIGKVSGGDDGANAKSPHPKHNKGGKAEGKMGKSQKEESGRTAPSFKDEVQTKDGNQGSGKERQKKVSDSDKASKTPSDDQNVNSPMNEV